MAEQKDFNSLDELFRKTFDDLPESPATTGWDQPNDRVWQHVQTRIKPPRQGWTGRQLLLATSAAVTIALGLYLAFARPQPPVPQPAPTPPAAVLPQSEMPQAQPGANVTQASESPAVVVPRSAAPIAPIEQTPTITAPSRNAAPATPSQAEPGNPPALPEVNTAGQRVQPGSGSLPLPGSRPESPNTTERRKNEAVRRGPWGQSLAPLPSAFERRGAPALPESLRLLPPTGSGKQ